VKRIIENGASHVGAAGSLRAAKGKATAPDDSGDGN
jgi:hypothetical protein